MENRLQAIEKILDKMQLEMVKNNTLLDVHIEGVKQNRMHIAKIETDLERVNLHITKVETVRSFLFSSLKYVGMASGAVAATLGILVTLGVL